MNILSPVARGSGVEVLHQVLADAIPGYRLACHSPWWTLMPPALAAFSSSRVDLIHGNSDLGCFLKRPGVPLVVSVHNYTSDRWMRSHSSNLQYLHYRTDLRLFTRLSVEVASAVVTVSRFVGELVRRDLGIDRPMRLIYNGVDERRFVPTAGRRPRRPFRVLFCGNPSRRKGAHLLEPLAAALGPAFEIRYTEGLSGSRYRPAQVTSNSAAFRSLGSVPHAHMAEVYQSADLLFMPSAREGFGLCVAEAMACGLPVVACGSSAMAELVVDKLGGFLCGVDDLDGYIEAIRTIAGNPRSAREMGEYNRSLVEERFTRERMVREYRALFSDLIETRGVTD